jgi:hypothetical protein
MDLIDLLLEFSAQNSSSGRVLRDKEQQLRDWAQDFEISGQERINTLVSKTMDSLRDEVPSFAEDHYDDRSAGENWRQLVESSGVNRKVEKLQKKLLDECKKALSEVARELKSELSLVASLSSDRHIKMDRIFDTKRALKWVSGLGVAIALLVSGPLSWGAAIAIGVVGVVGGLFSCLFDDREKKARSAREELSRQLSDDINKMERDLRKKLGSWFRQKLLRKQIHVLLSDLEAVTSGLFELADVQRTLAWMLNERQKNLGRALIKEALSQLGAVNLLNSIVDVARVPGHTMFLTKPNVVFPRQICSKLEILLGEQIWFVTDTKDTVSILSQAIGGCCRKNKISIEKKVRIAHVPLDNLDMVTKARVKLAQQLTGFYVME